MNDGSIISLISLLGFLILAGSALASYRMSWGKFAQLGLVWLAIFAGLFMIARLAGLSM
ncbi:MAG: hypothetical protein AAF127_02035 [Pseudomonadota bacterium]